MHHVPGDHAALPRLFDPAIPNKPALWAVLEGRHTGSALVDRAGSPSQCVLRTDAILTYASRRIGQAFLHEAIAHFRQTGSVWLVRPGETPAQPPAPRPARTIPRLEFRDCDPQAPALAGLRRRLPHGFDIRPIDRELLQRCAWRSDMEFYAGSLEGFLRHGMGLALMRGDEIVTEAYASALGAGTAEIGAITWEAHRGRGYAPIACAHLIQACARRGLRAYWSCDAGHQASIRLARKLGFRQEGAYHILEYEPLR
jgi:RimJ/RimL family protein N-acetyltransferase